MVRFPIAIQQVSAMIPACARLWERSPPCANCDAVGSRIVLDTFTLFVCLFVFLVFLLFGDWPQRTPRCERRSESLARRVACVVLARGLAWSCAVQAGPLYEAFAGVLLLT